MPEDKRRWTSEQDHGRSLEEERRRGGYGQEGYGREGYGERSGGRYGTQGSGRRDYGSGGSYGRYEGSFGGYSRAGDYGQEGFGGWYGRGGYGGRGGEERGLGERASDEVSSWFGDKGAERRRQQDYRGRGPRGYRRSDDRIREDVSDRLSDDPYVDASEIEVSVSNGEVTLSGTVDSRQARRRAEDLAENVSGVTHVQNNLRLRQQGASGTSGYGTGAGSGAGLSGGYGTTTGATGGTAPGTTTAGVGDAPRVGGFGESIAYAAETGSDVAGATGTTAGSVSARSPLYALRGEEIVGKTLYGPDGEEISSVKNIVVARQGRAAALVVGVGGLLGLGEHQVAVPLDQVQVSGGDRLTTTLTKDALKSMPAYEESGYEPADPSRRLDEISTAG